MKQFFTLCLAALAVCLMTPAPGTAHGGSFEQLQTLPEQDLRVGDVWSLADERYPEVELTIVRIEQDHHGEVFVHVSLSGPIAYNGGVYTGGAAHLPFTPDALAQSVSEKLATDGVPAANFEEVYQIWLDAYTSGTGGVFDVPVGEALGFMLDQMPKDIPEDL